MAGLTWTICGAAMGSARGRVSFGDTLVPVEDCPNGQLHSSPHAVTYALSYGMTVVRLRCTPPRTVSASVQTVML